MQWKVNSSVLFWVILLQPLFKFPLLPKSISLLISCCIYHTTLSMLNTVLPLTTVFTSIRISIYTHAMFLVLFIQTFVFSSILPSVYTFSMHHSILKFTFELTSINPLKLTKSAHFILKPFSWIFRTIRPVIYSKAMLYRIFKVSIVIATIRPNFNSIVRTTTLSLSEDCKTWTFINLPHTFILILAIGCFENSYAYGLSIEPVSFKCWTIRPLKLTVSTLYIFTCVFISSWFTLMRLFLFHGPSLTCVF